MVRSSLLAMALALSPASGMAQAPNCAAANKEHNRVFAQYMKAMNALNAHSPVFDSNTNYTRGYCIKKKNALQIQFKLIGIEYNNSACSSVWEQYKEKERQDWGQAWWDFQTKDCRGI